MLRSRPVVHLTPFHYALASLQSGQSPLQTTTRNSSQMWRTAQTTCLRELTRRTCVRIARVDDAESSRRCLCDAIRELMSRRRRLVASAPSGRVGTRHHISHPYRRKLPTINEEESGLLPKSAAPEKTEHRVAGAVVALCFMLSGAVASAVSSTARRAPTNFVVEDPVVGEPTPDLPSSRHVPLEPPVPGWMPGITKPRILLGADKFFPPFRRPRRNPPSRLRRLSASPPRRPVSAQVRGPHSAGDARRGPDDRRFRCGRDADIPWSRFAATPRTRRGHSVKTGTRRS